MNIHSARLAQLFGLDDTTGNPDSLWRKDRMYAICFDLDMEALKRHYRGPSHNYAYEEIKRVFERHGFTPIQGSVYFGNKSVTPVTCVVAVQAVRDAYPWFARAVRDIRMLRIEENNDLMPAIAVLNLFEEEAPTTAAV